MKLRDILILFAALVFSGFIAFLAREALKPVPPKLEPHKNTVGKPLNLVLVAKTDIEVGTKFTEDKFRWQEWPEGALNPEYITKHSGFDFKQLDKGIIKHQLNADEPVTLEDVILVGDKSALAGIITPGMRAFTIPFERDPYISTWVAAGDWIDVVISHEVSGKVTTQTVLRHVKVLAINDKLQHPTKQDSEKAPKTITIEVTPEQVEELATALKGGNDPIISLYSLTSPQQENSTIYPPKSSLLSSGNKKENKSIVILRGDKVNKVEFE
ncbi:MAG: Flp pilus assembly protein CpaB [Alphaproteobacteria bacterium]|nr:Flp pilus assembly protein CpaB [Alphaproteobacteria bacterium]